jgi:hypothetical protein
MGNTIRRNDEDSQRRIARADIIRNRRQAIRDRAESRAYDDMAIIARMGSASRSVRTES